MRSFSFFILFGLFGGTLAACEQASACSEVIFEDRPFTLCKADAGADMLKTADKTLLFAMNGGMYHANRDPVGLYIEKGVEFSKLNTNPGPGNFHLLPNGVFWMGDGISGVTAADSFNPTGVTYATQSGPMLVIDNKLHPAFRPQSTSLRIRNGVGQTADGQVYFEFPSFRALFPRRAQNAQCTVFGRDSLKTLFERFRPK